MARRVIRRSSGFRGGRSSGRLTEWLSVPFPTALSLLPADTVILHSNLDALGLAKRPFTITRTIGLLLVQSDQNASPEFGMGALGMIVASDKAVTLGVTAIPDPTVETGDDEWFMYQAFGAEGSASTNVGRPIETYAFDSRAQRKVVDGQNVAVMISNAAAIGAFNFQLHYRILVKLS